MSKKIDMAGWYMPEHGVLDSLITVIEEDKKYNVIHNLKSKRTYWKCKCACGTLFSAEGTSIRTGKTKSCGCLQRKIAAKAHKIDMAGWYMPNHGVPDSIITVIEEDKEYHLLHNLSSKNQMAYWKYQCKCGNIKTALGEDLRTGKVLSCGCLQKQRTREALMKDISNQKFNHLVALYIDPNKNSGKGVFWICKCDCGNIVSVRCADLINGHTTSCGCIKSKGEELIISLLIKNNIPFSTQQSYSDLKAPTGNALLYDFYINNQFLLEYDGE